MSRRFLHAGFGRSALHLLWVQLTLVAPATLAGQDFRVDTEVFVGEEKEPLAATLTLFADGLVYDFLYETKQSEPREITVYDPRMQHFTLLDPRQRLKTVITVQEVQESCISLNLHAKESKDPFFVFAAEPKFEVTEEAVKERGQDATRLTLTGEWMIYSAVGRKPEIAVTAASYRAFADAHNRLNALRPGGMLPAPRAELNEQLGARGLLPSKVSRVILPQSRFQRKLEVRSEHLFNWTLSRLDREKIEQVGGYRVNFESLPFDKYRDRHNHVPPAPQQQAKR